MTRTTITAAILLFSFLAAAQKLPAADGFYKGRVRSVFVNDSGSISVLLTPDPADQGFACRNGWASVVASPIVDEGDQKEIEARLYSLFLKALEMGAAMSIYLEERTTLGGVSYCLVDRAQVWRPTTPTTADDDTPPGNSDTGGTIRYYGAMAVGSDLGAALSWNRRSQSQADTDALASCRESYTGCTIRVRWGSGQCLSLVRGSTSTNSALFWSVTSTLESARRSANQSCVDAGWPTCQVLTTACNREAGASSSAVVPVEPKVWSSP